MTPRPTIASTQPTGLLQRRLPADWDPFDLYEALGAGPDTGLFEAPRGPSLLMHHAAIRAECRGEMVSMHALSANGESLLEGLRLELADNVVSARRSALTLRIALSRSLDSDERLRAPSPIHAIRHILKIAMPAVGEEFAAIALGVIAFEYAGLGEDFPDWPGDDADFPDFLFWIPDTLILFEPGAVPRILCAAFPDSDATRASNNYHDAAVRLGHTLEECERAKACQRSEIRILENPAAAQVDLDDAAYMIVVQQLKEEIKAGEVYQIVPSRTFMAPCPDPVQVHAVLRRIETRSYRFFVRGADFILFGASPETSVRIAFEDQRRRIEVRPIAGTRKRGLNADEDDRLECELRLDHKEIAEHIMLVDLARNDVARISRPGTRRVSKLMAVERHSKVMHLVSSVTGELGDGFDAFDALTACLNVGTLSGAPKIRAMQLLRGAERDRRGAYGGAIGWISSAGTMDTAVVIRSAMVKNGMAFVRAGAGVVHDSDPRSEAEETRRKASALLSVLHSVSAAAAL